MILITERARKRMEVLKERQETQQGRRVEGLHIDVHGTHNPEYSLAFIEEGKGDSSDVGVDVDGIRVFMAPRYVQFLEDVKIDFVTNLQQTGFKVENPKVVQSDSPAPPVGSSENVDSPIYQAVKKVLDLEINPAVASHGGRVSLVDVKDQIAYITMGGGCQGCGMADATLKQGVVVAIKKAVPEILDVLDATDHASGRNPYFTPGG